LTIDTLYDEMLLIDGDGWGTASMEQKISADALLGPKGAVVGGVIGGAFGFWYGW